MRGHLRLSNGQKLNSPSGLYTRPTTARVREAAMNLVGSKLSNSYWLDLCSGSGVVSCEALDRGAKKILAIESNTKTAKICQSNLDSVAKRHQKPDITVIRSEVVSFLKKGSKKFSKKQKGFLRFDLVYFDPPYKAKIYNPVLGNLLLGQWLKEDSIVICEHSSSYSLETPSDWVEIDRRTYGSTTLLLISPPLSLHVDIDSKQQRIVLEEL